MRIFLRPITEKDGAHIVKWRNSAIVQKHCLTKGKITEESNAQFYRDYILTGKYKQFIVERVEEELGLAAYPIATVYLKDIDFNNKRCELCIFTSDDVEWAIDSQSLAIKKLLNIAFSDLGMHKVYSYVIYNVNEGMELLKKSGFNIESVLKSEAMIDGKYIDVYRLSIYNPSEK